MDAGTHLRAIWRRRVLVVGGAIAVGLVVFVLRSMAPATYTSSAVLFVVPGGGDARDVEGEVRRLTATYAALADDRAILRDAAARTMGITEEEAGRRTVVAESDDGQVQITATGVSAVAAADLANATATALAAAADLEQTDALRRDLAPLDVELQTLAAQAASSDAAGADANELVARQRAVFQARLERLGLSPARLDLVDAARAGMAERTPDPVRDSVLALLLALIVLAELAAIRAARRAGLEGRDPLSTLREWSHLPVFRIGSSKSGPDQSTSSLLHTRSSGPAHSDGFVMALAPLTSPVALDSAVRHLLRASIEIFGRATLLDVRSDTEQAAPASTSEPWETLRPSPADIEATLRSSAHLSSPQPVTVLVGDCWDSPEFLMLSQALGALTTVLVDAATVRRPSLQESLSALQESRTPPVALLVLEPATRRLRRASRRQGSAGTAEHGAAQGSSLLETGRVRDLGVSPDDDDATAQVNEPLHGAVDGDDRVSAGDLRRPSRDVTSYAYSATGWPGVLDDSNAGARVSILPLVPADQDAKSVSADMARQRSSSSESGRAASDGEPSRLQPRP